MTLGDDRLDLTETSNDLVRCAFCGNHYHPDEVRMTETADGFQQCEDCRATEQDWGGDHIADTNQERRSA